MHSPVQENIQRALPNQYEIRLDFLGQVVENSDRMGMLHTYLLLCLQPCGRWIPKHAYQCWIGLMELLRVFDLERVESMAVLRFPSLVSYLRSFL